MLARKSITNTVFTAAGTDLMCAALMPGIQQGSLGKLCSYLGGWFFGVGLPSA